MEVWAVGGGKGGTGKSFVAGSIAFCLADMGKRVVLLDADLGGANLHSFVGIKRPDITLGEFFESGTDLKDLVIPTGYDNLSIISGDLQSLDSDGIKYTQKLKLFRHVRMLDADYVIIDLGAGSHNNTIDTFLLADRNVVVTIPAITALENLYQFIKNVYYRKLKMSLGKRGKKDAVVQAWKNRQRHGIRNLRDLTQHLRSASPEMEAFFQSEVDTFRVSLALNQIRHSQDVHLGLSIKSVVRKYLGLNAEYSGYVRYDELILKSLNSGRPFFQTYRNNRSAREIEALTLNIMQGRQVREV